MADNRRASDSGRGRPARGDCHRTDGIHAQGSVRAVRAWWVMFFSVMFWNMTRGTKKTIFQQRPLWMRTLLIALIFVMGVLTLTLLTVVSHRRPCNFQARARPLSSPTSACRPPYPHPPGVALALTACGGQGQRIEESPPSSTVTSPTPTSEPRFVPSPVVVATPPVSDALLSDAQSYAADTGVDLDEAVRRLKAQELLVCWGQN